MSKKAKPTKKTVKKSRTPKPPKKVARKPPKKVVKKQAKKSKTPKPTAGMPVNSKMLLAFLERNKLTYAQFGEKIGVTKAWICSLVKGGKPSLRVAQEIEEKTGGWIKANVW